MTRFRSQPNRQNHDVGRRQQLVQVADGLHSLVRRASDTQKFRPKRRKPRFNSSPDRAVSNDQN
jgi:hypothetical protein